MNIGKARIVQYKDYVAGWLDSSIADYVELLADAPTAMTFALVTCLDSQQSPASLLSKSPELRSLAPVARPIGDAFVLPTKALLVVNSRSPIFHGFDEVWFFPDDKLEPKPATAWLVGPARIGNQKLRRLGSWMANNGCSLGLGDGEGLNLVVKAGGMVKQLIGHSLSQPEHALTSGRE